MNQKEYVAPQMVISILDEQDVIITSGDLWDDNNWTNIY